MAGIRARIDILTDEELVGYLNGLSLAGLANLVSARRAGRPLPLLYQSGVRYERERPGREQWQLPTRTYALREGDCEDLAAGWRVPELWLLGETQAKPFLKRVNPTLRHVQVRRADGRIEDPSRILGMK